jgi:hypothetical protein
MTLKILRWTSTGKANVSRSCVVKEAFQLKGVIGHHYPAGIGYLFSSTLAAALYVRADRLPHRVPYPYDDVVLGSWYYELGPAVEPDIPFYNVSLSQALAPKLDKWNRTITYQTTWAVNDRPGFHDHPNHGYEGVPIDWDTVCVHHVNIAEMRELRRLPEWEDEWTAAPADEGVSFEA